MKKPLTHACLVSFLILMIMGCNAAMNPPKVPGKVVAPTVKLLWTEEESVTNQQLSSALLGKNLGLNRGIVASVDQKAITLKEFDAAFFRALRDKPWNLSEKDLYHRVLNDLVVNELLLTFAEGIEEMEVTDFELDMEMERVSSMHPEGWVGYRRMLNMEDLSILDIREQIKENLLIKKAQSEIMRGIGSPSPQDIRREYEKRKGEFTTDDERDVSLIIIFNDSYKGKSQQLDDLLKRISQQLEKKPFSEVAKKFSEGPKADDGGRQGWIKKDGLAPELSKVAFNLAKSQMSGPHKTKDFSFFVLCHDAKIASSKSMEDVQAYLENSVQGRKRMALMQEKIKELYDLHHVRKLSPEDYLKYRSTLKK